MANFLTTREAFQRAAGNFDCAKYDTVDRNIEAASRYVEHVTHRYFLPRTETRTYRWPGRQGNAMTLWTDQDLLSVTTLQTKAQNDCPTTVSSCDFFLEPSNSGPPFNRIEIDLSSCSTFEAGDTPQRSISVAGCWGYSNCTRCGGTVSGCLGACCTTMTVSDASKVCVGNTLLVECERLFVADRDFAALDSIQLGGALCSSMSNNTVSVDACHGIQRGEVLRVDCEQMLVNRVRCNCINVTRAYAGTVLDSHGACTAVHINRTLTIERGVNGTCAAAHSCGTSICVYEPEHDIQNWALAEAIAMYHQEGAGWGREIGAGEGAREMRGVGLQDMRQRNKKQYTRIRNGAI